MEEYIQFQEFKHHDALTFGMLVLDEIKKNGYKNVRIRVRYEQDLVFQYLMDDKNGEEWLDKKERTVALTHQSSLYVYQHQDQYDLDVRYAICGGGYPLFVRGEYKGVFCVSGLRHDEDHDIIVKVLKKMEEKA